jgi:hypothetical protein
VAKACPLSSTLEIADVIIGVPEGDLLSDSTVALPPFISAIHDGPLRKAKASCFCAVQIAPCLRQRVMRAARTTRARHGVVITTRAPSSSPVGADSSFFLGVIGCTELVADWRKPLSHTPVMTREVPLQGSGRDAQPIVLH